MPSKLGDTGQLHTLARVRARGVCGPSAGALDAESPKSKNNNCPKRVLVMK